MLTLDDLPIKHNHFDMYTVNIQLGSFENNVNVHLSSVQRLINLKYHYIGSSTRLRLTHVFFRPTSGWCWNLHIIRKLTPVGSFVVQRLCHFVLLTSIMSSVFALHNCHLRLFWGLIGRYRCRYDIYIFRNLTFFLIFKIAD